MLNSNLILYSILIGTFMSLHYTWFKMINWNPTVALFYVYLFLTIFNLGIIIFSWEKIYSTDIEKWLLWLIITAFCIWIFVFLTIKWFQNGFNVVSFPLMNTIISTWLLVFINYYFFKWSLNLYNFIWLFLGVLSIYFLSLN